MEETLTSLERAKKRVKRLKGFYTHLSVYIVINIILLILKGRFLVFIVDKTGNVETQFIDWLDWNIISTPLIWGVFLAIHGIKVFSHPYLEKWEAKKIQKLMEREDEDNLPRYR